MRRTLLQSQGIPFCPSIPDYVCILFPALHNWISHIDAFLLLQVLVLSTLPSHILLPLTEVSMHHDLTFLFHTSHRIQYLPLRSDYMRIYVPAQVPELLKVYLCSFLSSVPEVRTVSRNSSNVWILPSIFSSSFCAD